MDHLAILPPEEPLSSTDHLEAVFIPTSGSEEELAQAAYLASLANPTPTGKLIAEFALRKIGAVSVPQNSKLVYSSQAAPVCGINLDGHMIREGSISSIEDWVRNVGGYFHCGIRKIVSQILSRGGFAMVVANESVDLGVVCLRRAH